MKILSCMYFPLKVYFCIGADQPFQFPEVAKKFVTAMLSSHGGAWPHILDLCSIMAYSLSLKSPFASQSYLLYSHPLTNMPPKCGMPARLPIRVFDWNAFNLVLAAQYYQTCYPSIRIPIPVQLSFNPASQGAFRPQSGKILQLQNPTKLS